MDAARFKIAYVVCALWSSTDESRDDGGDPLDKNYDVSDIAPETLAQMHADCDAFMRDNAADLAEAAAIAKPSEWSYAEQAGHDFWLTRNGHGAGFWDRGLGAVGERLTKACKPYGSVHLYVGDDGKIHA